MGSRTSTLDTYHEKIAAYLEEAAFRKDPRKLAQFLRSRELAAPQPSLIHAFLRHLHELGMLQRVYTQCIDGLEREMGLPVVETNGRLTVAVCPSCTRRYDGNWLTRVTATATTTTTTTHSDRTTLETSRKVVGKGGELVQAGVDKAFAPTCDLCGSVVKPQAFTSTLISVADMNIMEKDVAVADMVLCIGVQALGPTVLSMLQGLPADTPMIMVGCDAERVTAAIRTRVDDAIPSITGQMGDAEGEEDIPASDTLSDCDADAEAFNSITQSFEVAVKDWSDFMTELIGHPAMKRNFIPRGEGYFQVVDGDATDVLEGLCDEAGCMAVVREYLHATPSIPSSSTPVAICHVAEPEQKHAEVDVREQSGDAALPLAACINAPDGEKQKFYDEAVDLAGISILSQALSDFDDLDDLIAAEQRVVQAESAAAGFGAVA